MKALKLLCEHGCVAFERSVQPDLLSYVRSRASDPLPDGRTHTFADHELPAVERLLCPAPIAELRDAVFGRPVPWTLARSISHLEEPGWHRDRGIKTSIEPGGFTYLNILVALVDFTKENGATELMLGSHRPLSPSNPYRSVTALMPAGSALVFFGSATFHKTGVNRTQSRRWALRLRYEGANVLTAEQLASSQPDC